MKPKTASLGSYISRIQCRPTFPIFARERMLDNSTTHRSPILTSGRCNRIMVFPGSFNPPHLSHKELLCHGFWRSGKDVNVIAAILPLDDESLETKFGTQEETMILTKAQRVRLWRDSVLGDWYWIYDRSLKEWNVFREGLTEAITQDGFDIKFVFLCGPDIFEMSPIPARRPAEVFVSDVGRPAYFTNGSEGYLTALKDFKPWEEIVLDIEELKKWIKEDCSRLHSVLSPKSQQDADHKCRDYITDKLLEDAVETIRAVRTCRSSGDPEVTVRFIPGQSQISNITSTHVRDVIKTFSGDKTRLFNELQQLVLNPEILMLYMSGVAG